MIVSALFFYLFSAICIASAFMVIAAKNPVHSVLFLILAFVNAAGLFVMMGAEFLAMILIVVYVGAVAVLFLFVVMMLDVVFLVELLLVVAVWAIGPGVPKTITAPIPPPEVYSNTEALGLVLYTRYAYFFQIAGLVLLVAMIGAIVLTLRHKPNVRRQNIADQVARTRESAVELKQVQPGQGI